MGLGDSEEAMVAGKEGFTGKHGVRVFSTISGIGKVVGSYLLVSSV